jgi:hypothetical protein
MNRKEALAIFTLAGIEVLDTKALVDGYGYNPDDERFFETPMRQCWWFLKTKYGWIEMGWRKRVIQINWKDTDVVAVVTQHGSRIFYR